MGACMFVCGYVCHNCWRQKSYRLFQMLHQASCLYSLSAVISSACCHEETYCCMPLPLYLPSAASWCSMTSICHRWFASRGSLAVHCCQTGQIPDSHPPPTPAKHSTRTKRPLVSTCAAFGRFSLIAQNAGSAMFKT